jgi:hypothetical protein
VIVRRAGSISVTVRSQRASSARTSAASKRSLEALSTAMEIDSFGLRPGADLRPNPIRGDQIRGRLLKQAPRANRCLDQPIQGETFHQ